MSFKLHLLVCAAVALGSAFLSPVFASNLEGTFIYVPAKSGNINWAIDKTVEGMNIFTRTIARDQLRKNNKPDKRITLGISPTEVSITTDDDAPMRTTPDGTPAKWRNEDGEYIVVSTHLAGDVLRQTIKAEGGERVNVYSASPDGQTLTLDVTMSSDRLKIPVKYRLVYQRG